MCKISKDSEIVRFRRRSYEVKFTETYRLADGAPVDPPYSGRFAKKAVDVAIAANINDPNITMNFSDKAYHHDGNCWMCIIGKKGDKVLAYGVARRMDMDKYSKEDAKFMAFDRARFMWEHQSVLAANLDSKEVHRQGLVLAADLPDLIHAFNREKFADKVSE